MRLLAPLALVLVGGCASTVTVFSGTFDTPGPVAALHPDHGGPFSEPVGYAADREGGHVRVLALARGVYLADEPFASFLRGTGLASGARRVVADMVAFAPDATSTSVIVADRWLDQLVVLPHVVGVQPDGRLRLQRPTITDQTWGGSVPLTLDGLELSDDTAASETWTLTWEGEAFRVVGSRSGDRGLALPDVAFTPTDRALSFVVRLPGGEPALGDVATVVVDRGSTEIDLPAAPLDLALSPDHTVLALTLQDDSGGALHLLDPRAPADLGPPVALPAGARPYRAAFTDDGTQVVVGDLAQGAVYGVDVTSGAVTTWSMPWPVADVVPLRTDRDGGDRVLLHIHPALRDELWVYDPQAGTFVDVNPWTAELDPLRTGAAVTGMTALHTPYTWPADSNDTPRSGRSVAVTLSSGKVVWVEEGTGCLVSDAQVPRTRLVSSFSQTGDYEADFPIAVPGTAYLEATEDPSRHVSVNSCAGVARSQTWAVIFDGVVGAWRVRGLVSGDQEALAYEDERYVSDQGEISFLLRSGPQPSEDGWGIAFDVLAGTLQADGDNAGDLQRELPFDNPAPPATYMWTDPDPDNGGRQIPFVIAASTASDFVVRVRATTGQIDAVWD